MSQIPSIASSPNFQAIFDDSLKEYEKKTKKDLLMHPLMAQLQACNSPTDILVVLRTQVQQFEQSMCGNDKLTKWLNPTVNVLYTFSTALGEGVGLVFSPAKVIFAGAGVLLLAAKDVVASQDALVNIFERIESFFKRLETYTDVAMIEAMRDVVVKIMVEVLGIFAIVTKEMKQGRAKKYFKRLAGRRDIEDALSRLDKLTQDEGWMAITQVLKVAHRVEERVKIVGDKLNTTIKDGEEIKALVQQTVNNKMSETERKQVRRRNRAWLSPPDPSTNQNIAYSAQHEGTMAWFFQGSIFTEWKSNSITSLLWIHGKPGSGKSILCSAIIQNILKLQEAELASIAYFYFDFRDTDKQDLCNLLPSLLTQLSARSDGCCDILSLVYETHDGAHKPSTSAMIACLEDMLTLPDEGPIYIILDALDECPITSGVPPARKEVLNFLKYLVSLRLSNLHICVSSRPEIDIQAALEPLAFRPVSIHDQSGQKKDIEDYIRSVVYADSDMAMGIWKEKDKELVIETLVERADGMFRWVFCQLEVLQHCLPQNIQRTLNSLPKSLDETYERVLKEIGMANQDHVCRLLQCLTAAIRPLRVEELAEILALDFDEAEGATPKLNEDWRLENQQRVVLSTCSSLITLVDDGDSRVIQFSHSSVREFLTSNRLTTFKGDISHFHIIPEAAHATLAQACLGILLQLDGNSDNNRVESNFPLARYASQHWVEHAQFGTVSSRIEDGMRRLFDSAKPFFAAWLQLCDIDDCWTLFGNYGAHRGSPLYFASLFGFRDLAAHIIAEHPEQVNARGGFNYSPLAAALHKRHFKVAELLHQHGANVDVTGFRNRTPLQAASEEGLTEVARWLLDHGADSNSQGDDHWTPLHQASNFGYVETVRLLLQHGANTNVQDKVYFATPLHLASSSGRLEVARLLLDHVADVDPKNKDGMTPLHLASASEGVEVVSLLLDRGANINAEDKARRTPLHLAWSTEIARLLLDRGASADVKNKEGRTPPVATLEPAPEGASINSSDSIFQVCEDYPLLLVSVFVSKLTDFRPSPAGLWWHCSGKMSDEELQEALSEHKKSRLFLPPLLTPGFPAKLPMVEFCRRYELPEDIPSVLAQLRITDPHALSRVYLRELRDKGMAPRSIKMLQLAVIRFSSESRP